MSYGGYQHSQIYGSSKRLLFIGYIITKLDETLVVDVTAKKKVVIEKFANGLKESQKWEIYEGTINQEVRHAIVNSATKEALAIHSDFFGGKYVVTKACNGDADFIWFFNQREETFECLQLSKHKKRQLLDVKNEKKTPGMCNILIQLLLDRY